MSEIERLMATLREFANPMNWTTDGEWRGIPDPWLLAQAALSSKPHTESGSCSCQGGCDCEPDPDERLTVEDLLVMKRIPGRAQYPEAGDHMTSGAEAES